MTEIIDMRRHALARDHGTKVAVDDEGYEYVQLGPNSRIVFDYPAPREWFQKLRLPRPKK